MKTTEQALRERLRKQRTPNVALLDQDGRALRFYDDVMKDRIVVLNVMYSACTNICSPATRNLLEARELLGPLARDLHFVSMSLTPLSDPPEVLRAFKKQQGIDGNWTFLTGLPQNVDTVLRALRFVDDENANDLLSHSAMARLCDERLLRWTHLNTMLRPRSIARMIRFELS